MAKNWLSPGKRKRVSQGPSDFKNLGIDLELDGDKETLAMFHNLNMGLRKNVLKQATLKGAEVVAQEARLRAPRGRSGNLKRKIRSVVLTTRDELATIGVSWLRGKSLRGSGFYGLFLEKGTKPRFQKKDKRFRMRGKRKLLDSYIPKATGTVSPKPFLTPAFDAKRNEASHVIKAEISRTIRKIITRRGKGRVRG